MVTKPQLGNRKRVELALSPFYNNNRSEGQQRTRSPTTVPKVRDIISALFILRSFNEEVSFFYGIKNAFFNLQILVHK